MITKFEEVFDKTKKLPKKKVSVALADDETVIEAVIRANAMKLADYILVGDKKNILKT